MIKEQYKHSELTGKIIGCAIEVHKQLKIQPRLLLAGHFCIFTKNNEVDYLPESVYHCLSIEKVLLLEANTEIILKNLSLRDKREYTYEQLFRLQQAERIAANAFKAKIGCDFFSYSMRFEEIKSIKRFK